MRLMLSMMLLLVMAGHSSEVWAAKSKKKLQKQVDNKSAALIIDSQTGAILHQENAEKLRYPASLTKMMTLYLAFEALRHGELRQDQRLVVSRQAASQPRMSLGLRAGDVITVQDAMLALIVRSANDAAVVLAEAVSGSEEQFAQLMTRRAKELNMNHTVFRNASGLPNAQQKTTAVDLARLALALKHHYPEYYPLFSKNEFTFRGHKLSGHNRVTQNYPGAEGLKTGFVNASGFNLVTTAKRENKQLVGVVLGGSTARARDQKMMRLLDRHFGVVQQSRNENVEKKQNKTTSSLPSQGLNADEAARLLQTSMVNDRQKLSTKKSVSRQKLKSKEQKLASNQKVTVSKKKTAQRSKTTKLRQANNQRIQPSVTSSKTAS
jgi:D-alanyl-D-alanine carboxypeptidase